MCQNVLVYTETDFLTVVVCGSKTGLKRLPLREVTRGHDISVAGSGREKGQQRVKKHGPITKAVHVPHARLTAAMVTKRRHALPELFFVLLTGQFKCNPIKK